MRVVIAGLGVQGKKRLAIAGSHSVATVDPYDSTADYPTVSDVPLASYDAVLVCTPDEAKLDILDYLLKNGKHVLVEKPLFSEDASALTALAFVAKSNGVTCYTAYNHRFEPHFVRLKELIESGKLGRIYRCRLFYGNGTARDVRSSAWRDKGAGVLPDLGSHLLDAIAFWFGATGREFSVISCDRFENAAFDHVVIGSDGDPVLELEMTLLSWRNHFTCDLFAENGSAHISSLCKWGPSEFTCRWRKLPSGRPDEETVTLVQPDPTWQLEYEHFLGLCENGRSNIENDIWINTQLTQLSADSLATAPVVAR